MTHGQTGTGRSQSRLQKGNEPRDEILDACSVQRLHPQQVRPGHGRLSDAMPELGLKVGAKIRPQPCRGLLA